MVKKLKIRMSWTVWKGFTLCILSYDLIIFGSKLKSVKWEMPLRWIWIVDYQFEVVAELKENRLKSMFGRVQASKASDCVLGIRIGGA